MVGTFGDVGSYSFYFSHHITTGEGGACVTDSLEMYDTLKCMRAHGWSRELSNQKELEAAHPDVDPRFLFVNAGFNLRPVEMAGVLGIRQLQRIEYMNNTRNLNRLAVIDCLTKHPKYTEQMTAIEATPEASVAWFGLTFLLKPEFAHLRHIYATHLTSRGCENRPIISGNFAGQPALKAIGLDIQKDEFPKAEHLGTHGFFIGLHVTPLAPETISDLVEIMMDFDFVAQDDGESKQGDAKRAKKE
jgi:CDP-6-deoxy-D-xylo-4-hexulose-3-dehydrase